ncbi:MAG: sulfotransferase [Verrucomicrobia bacterium]|nr:MAG: sulfotransferase [Verrucomicrobiota bacterium]
MKLSTEPIIVVGMHRSGTSLVTRLLEAGGVFTGWLRDENDEALFFLKRNEAILQACGGSWENPGAIDGLLASESAKARIVERLEADIRSTSFWSFIGFRSRAEIGQWAWKDPRNSLLLELWLEIFPRARVIHVVRNGVDVARSLAVRANRDILSAEKGQGRSRSRYWRELRPERLVEWYQYLWTRFGPNGRLRCMGVPRTLLPTAGFELWEDYLRRIESGMSCVQHSLTIRYEDLLSDPEESIKALEAFAGVRFETGVLEACCQSLRPQRAFAFKADHCPDSLLEMARRSVWMHRFYPELEISRSSQTS